MSTPRRVLLVIDNIGSLITNDPALGRGPLGIVEDASVVITDDVVEAVGPAGAVADRSHRCRRGLRATRLRRLAHPPRLRRRPRRGVHRPNGRPAVRRRRDPGDDRGDPRRVDRASSTAGARGCAEAHRAGTTTIEIKSGYGLNVVDEVRSLEIAETYTDESTFLGAHLVPAEFEGRADDYIELVCGEMLDGAAESRQVDRRVLRDRRVRRRPVPGRARGRASGGPRAAAPRQPTRSRARGAAGRRVRLRLRRPLHLPERRRHRGARRQRHGRHLSPRHRLLDPSALSRRPPGARRRCHRGHRLELQPGLQLHDIDLVLHRARGARHAHDDRRGGPGGHVGGAAALQRTDVGRLTPGSAGHATILDAPTHDHLAYRPGEPLIRHTVGPLAR